MGETKKAAGEIAAETMGLNSGEDMPWWLETAYHAMENSPSMSVLAGYSSFRTRNTIMKGGWSPGDAKGKWATNTNRKGWSRFSSTNVFTPSRVQEIGSTSRGWGRARNLAGGAGRVNAPYNGAQVANWVGRKSGSISRIAAKHGPTSELISGGMLGQMSAGSALARGGAVGQSGAWAMKMDRHATRRYMSGYQGSNPSAMNAGVVRNARAGALNQVYGGAVQAIQFGEQGIGTGGRQIFSKVGSYVARDLASMGIQGGMGTGVRAAAAGARTGFAHIGAQRAAGQIGKVAATRAGLHLAGYAGLAAIDGVLPFGEIAAAAWFAYDMTKLTVGLAKDIGKSTVKLAGDAAKSWKGGIDQAPFGAGFKDTTAASTSRSRGVAAIQNSRLNGRSVLGHEAAGLSAMYG